MTEHEREIYTARWSKALSRIGARNLLCLPEAWKTLLVRSNDLVRKTILLETIAEAMHR